MKARFLALAALIALAACSGQNRYEKEAQSITEAVQANDLRPVQNDIAPGQNISRVKIAEWSDELNAQGKLLSLKEVTPCPVAGAHCFVAKFEKHNYNETMMLNEQNKVVNWNFHMADASAGATTAP